MTAEQYQHLASLFAQSHRENKEEARLVRATAAIDRCDGSVPERTRRWIRALDGWSGESVTDNFLLNLAKSAGAGDLLGEVRRWINGPTAAAVAAN